MNTIFKIATWIVVLISCQYSWAQFLTNNNVAITIQSGLQVTVQGDIQNQNSTSINNNGVIDFNGNWINNANNNCFGTSQGTVIMNGTINTIGGSFTTVFNNLLLGNQASYTLQNDITVGGSYASPSGILNVEKSILDLNSKTLFINNNDITAITTTGGHILSEDVDNSSKVIWTINSAPGNHTIPFGNASGDWIPLSFMVTAGDAGNVTFSTYATNSLNQPYPVSPSAVTHVHNMMGNDNSANMVDRFWQVNASGNPTASLTFTYAPSENAQNGNTNMIAQRWVNPVSGWSLPLPSQSNPSSQSVMVGNVTQFGPWAVTTSQSPLPIVMLQFTAKAENNSRVVCKWTTASEINNDYFNVERSKDGIHFTSVGVVDGSGNSNVPHSYSFVDESPYQGISYYRIKQTDYNGAFTYSVVRTVTLNAANNLSLEVYPNPVVDLLTLNSSAKSTLKINVVDAYGRTVYTTSMQATAQINFSDYASGIYFINVTDDVNGKKSTYKIVKEY